MAHPLRDLETTLNRAGYQLLSGTIAVLPQYLRDRLHRALYAAELRRVRRRRMALAGSSAVVALGVVALRSAKRGDDL